MRATSEQEYKVEVYYEGRPVFKAGYFETLEEARESAGESLGLDGSVREVRVLDHSGRIVETLEKGAK